MKPEKLNGESLTLVLWGEDKKGKKDVAAFSGIITFDGSEFFFEQPTKKVKFALQDDWIPRIQITTDEIKDIVHGSKYVLHLSIGDEPEGADYLQTGLKWPK